MTNAETAFVTLGTPGRRIRVARWLPETAAPRATVLVFNGLSEFIEKYEEVAADLLKRNLAVLSLDWGGQGLSDRLLPNRHKIHTVDYVDRLDEVDALIAWGKETLGELPTVVLAHSMGGHIALRYVAERSVPRLAAFALSAPMVSIRYPSWLVRPLSNLVSGLGFSERYPPFYGDYNYDQTVGIPNTVTSDRTRGMVQHDAILNNHGLAVGNITWGWMRASQASISHLKQPGVLEKIIVPTIFGMAGKEMLVSNDAIKRAVARIPNADLIELPGSRHEILMERDEFRAPFFNAFDQLLTKAGL
ncbi:MAG: alpha/beta hydrolase [Pseudomonadota bacterium]